ncbi:MAG: hypothetical protein ABIH67_02220 [Candidatus Uhrbacteria bacterium]
MREEPAKAFVQVRKLRDAIKKIELLLVARDTTVSDGSVSGQFLQALKVVKDQCPKEEWVRQAWVIWIEHGLDAWEAFLRNPKWVYPRPEGPFPANVALPTFCDHLTIANTGQDCKRLLDRFLKIIDQIRRRMTPMSNTSDANHWSLEMTRLIARRFGVARFNDPQADVQAFVLLMQHYGLDPELLKRAYSSEIWKALDLNPYD